MTDRGRVLVLHIGTRKSGTTYLQTALSRSHDALRAQGVSMPLRDWADHRVSLGDPLLHCVGDDEEATRASQTLRVSVERLRAATEPRLLLTYEELAELDEARIAALAGLLSDFDVRVVVTARHWGAVLPSEWQQLVKEHLVHEPFPDFLEAIRTGQGPVADLFLGRHDLVQILRRWAGAFGEERITLVPLPAWGVDPDLLPRVFCDLIGVDPTTLTYAPRAGNRSMSYAAAETLRRIQLANQGRLPEFIRHFRSYEYRVFLRAPLESSTGPTAQVTPEYRPWCEDAARNQVEALSRSAYPVVGDLADLVPHDWPEPVPAPTDSEIAEMAVSIAADLTLRLVNEAREPREQAQEPLPPKWRRVLSRARRALIGRTR